MEPLKQDPMPGVFLAIVILAILLFVSLVAGAGCSRSPGHSQPDTTVWRIGGNTLCCEYTDWYRRDGFFVLECGEVGRVYVFNTALNTKVPCEGSVE
jgi:hypothetical protein